MRIPDLIALMADARATPFVGEAIVFFRNQRGLTQEELAKKAHVSLSTLKRLEAGRKRGGWAETLEVLAKALSIDIARLFEKAQEIARATAVHLVFKQLRKVAS